MFAETDILERIAAPENLLVAWRAVRGNIPRYRRARAAGVDGVSLVEFEQDLALQLNALSSALLSSRYEPQPTRSFMLPKKSGGQRQINVLTVRDRVAQRAAQQIIEPIWEPHFLDCSFGYRPGLSTANAVQCANSLRASGQRWVVDGDIQACYDNLDHQLLLRLVRRRVKDHRVLELLRKWLAVGILDAGPPQANGLELLKGAQTVAGWLEKGVGWALESPGDEYPADGYLPDRDPYAAARYGSYRPPEALYYPGNTNPAETRQRAWKRLVASGIIWGASWLKPAAEVVRKAAETTLATPAGRRTLIRAASAGGGLAAAGAGLAATAYLISRRSTPAGLGVLQGSPLSPLLANIYLHPFDCSLRKQDFHLVRFADDWLVLCRDQECAERAYNAAWVALARLRLKINPEKTRILAPGEKINWLGQVVG